MISSPVAFLYFYTSLSMVLFVLMISLHHTKKYRFYIGFSVIILFSILLATRDTSIGSDSANYFLLVSNPDNFTQKIEPIMYMIASITRFLGGESFVFFLIISLIINLLHYVTFYKIDRKNYLIYTAFLSVSFLFLNANINILRQGIAIGFVFLSIYYLVHYKTYKYLIFATIAVLVHSSAIVVFIMPLFLALDTRRKLFYFATVLSGLFLSGVTIISLLSLVKDLHWILGRLHWYITWDKLTPFNLKHVYFLYFALLITYIYRYDSLDVLQKRYLSIFSSLFFIIFIFKMDDFLVDRFSFYYIPLVVYLYVNLINLVNTRQKQLILIVFILFPFLWIFKTAYQHNLWWVLGLIR